MSPKVILVSSEDKQFAVDVNVAQKSILIRNMINDLNPDGLEDDFEVPTPNVRSAVLEKVLEWCDHYKDINNDWVDDDDEQEDRRALPIPDWDRDFLDIEDQFLYEIISAANYLNIRPLLECGCKTVAEKVKFKSPEELRKLFSVQ